jgi:indolepyruvate ferredoxin oxidoreductase
MNNNQIENKSWGGPSSMEMRQVALDDRYTATSGKVLLNGAQALLVAMMRQSRLDQRNGVKSAGFISGYRGSPLSSVDTEAWSASRHLAAENIRFQPGINEDLALTAVWGTQQVALDPRANVDGVFALWYGKGAGLDRCGDVLRHAHGAGSSRRGGVLVVSGDDHALKSSSQAYHSEPTFIDMQMPVLYPANIQEVLDYAILGWAMSRQSGCYVGLKVLAEHINSTTVVDVGLDRVRLADLDLPQLNDRWIRWPDPWPDVERRLLQVKLPAALAFARLNGINRVVTSARAPRLGIVTSGKSYLDVVQALSLVDLTPAQAAERGISILKIGMPWPADEQLLRAFCREHAALLVVEEKRDLIEAQVRSALYSLPDGQRPVVLGRFDRNGAPLFPVVGELDCETVLQALRPEIETLLDEPRRVLLLRGTDQPSPLARITPPRAPYFCSGCPHSTSTRVPEGSRALGGVGCHFMATGMERATDTFTQMGGEGVPWIGTSPFTDTAHVFVNLGEGTYYHSGSLAIRAAVAAGANITYKILYNDAIAMTGGQPVEGTLRVADIARQLTAEGVERIEIVSEDPDALLARGPLPAGIPVHHRDTLLAVESDLAKASGVSALIYDQACATEKRRRRKRGKMAQAPRRIFINERVCEGCGDCSVQSNCLSVVPLETDYGRKRAIDQASCNQDYSCVEGFCPSFVSLEGAKPRRSANVPPVEGAAELPEPQLPALVDDATYDVFVAGVGGTGIVTVSALLAMAAFIEGKQCSVFDKLGMAQKYGAVHGHVRIAASAAALNAAKIPAGRAALMIAGDLRVATEPGILEMVDRRNGALVVASEQAIGGEFVRNPDHDFQSARMKKALRELGAPETNLFPARDYARRFLGDEVAANLILLGHAWQKGLIPLGLSSIERAIELNGAAVALNKAAFRLGRLHALRPEALIEPPKPSRIPPAGLSWQDLASQREAELVRYQDRRYAARFRTLVDMAAQAEVGAMGAAGELAHAVAENFSKLMAYKDEYEVARLYADPVFLRQLHDTFEDGARPAFYLAAPFLARRDPVTGLPRKRRFGPWLIHVFRVLAKLKFLRGTAFDLFGRHPDRKEERALVDRYEADIRTALQSLSAATHRDIVRLAALPIGIRGYGHIKKRSIEKSDRQREDIFASLKGRDEHAPIAVPKQSAA